MTVTLATYNIHACIGADGRFEPDRTAHVLREVDADVVALQEVEHHDVNGSDLLDYLATKTGMTPIAGPTLLRETRHYGNALLTRLPILAVNRVDLTLPGHEARGALDVTLASNGRRMQVVATHLWAEALGAAPAGAPVAEPVRYRVQGCLRAAGRSQ